MIGQQTFQGKRDTPERGDIGKKERKLAREMRRALQ
jgi:hypothetical protein